MEGLKPCPCGKTPTKLLISQSETTKYAYIYGNCCTEWIIEFRTKYYKLDSPECMELAIAEWNNAPRFDKIE